MRESSTRRIYDVQSWFYDATFGRLVRTRIAKAIREHLRIGPNDVVLDLGVGTGNALGFYPRPDEGGGKIIGIDLSPGMLRECQKKIDQHAWSHVSLIRGNALELPFADSTFDHLFISHVISVVSDPVRLLLEARRVAKPGARIVIVNHFRSANPVIGAIENWLSPLCTKLGWRSDLALTDLIAATGIEVDYRFKLEAIDLWETVVIRNTKADDTQDWSPAQALLA
jgi:phosphatidylethanolamine/phosphatidyl-N-methylethanolamine N-methyltransferase